jgi:hypothetical protein
MVLSARKWASLVRPERNLSNSALEALHTLQTTNYYKGSVRQCPAWSDMPVRHTYVDHFLFFSWAEQE